MNAQSIWAGQYYAYLRYRPRGKGFVEGARKVRAIKVFQRMHYGAERATTYVEVEDVNSGQILEVRARDIVDFWDDYDIQATKLREQREAARKEREERAKRMEEEQAQIYALCEKHGIKAQVNYVTRTVTIGYDELRRLLREEEVYSA